jgi:hypothetical protein
VTKRLPLVGALLKGGVMYKITMLPGLGKSTLARSSETVVNLEDYVGYTTYERGSYDLQAVMRVLSSEEVQILLSSKWFEDVGMKTDLFIGAVPESYCGHQLALRGRADLGRLFTDQTLYRWASDCQSYANSTGAEMIQLDLRLNEFIDPELIYARSAYSASYQLRRHL